MFKSAEYLRKEIGIEDLGKLISAYPNIFAVDPDTQIIPVVDFLEDELELDEDDIPSVLEAYPKLLDTDIDTMRAAVQSLLDLEVSEDVLGSIFRAFPALLTENTKPEESDVVKFLKLIGVTNIGRFITRLPPVLGYSVKNDLIPKWKFLKSVCQFPSFEVGRFPAYFSYPLDRVIKSRYEYLSLVKNLSVQLMPVDDILRYGDVDFAILIAKDLDGSAYAKFVKERNKRLKKRRNPKNQRGRNSKKRMERPQ